MPPLILVMVNKLVRELGARKETSLHFCRERHCHSTALAATLAAASLCIEMVLTCLAHHKLTRAGNSYALRVRFVSFHFSIQQDRLLGD
jgi:hypothetical protein